MIELGKGINLTPELVVADPGIDEELFRTHGGNREKWVDGVYRGDMESEQDCKLFAEILAEGGIGVFELPSNFGIAVNLRDRNSIVKAAQAKNQSPEKTMSAVSTAETISSLVSKRANHPHAHPVLSDPGRYQRRFGGGIAFTMFGLDDSIDVVQRVPTIARRRDNVGVDNINVLDFDGSPVSHRFQSIVLSRLQEKHNLQQGEVALGGTSCNLHGDDHPEIVNYEEALDFCQQRGISIILGRNEFTKKGQGSLAVFKFEEAGWRLVREGFYPNWVARRLVADIPEVQENRLVSERKHPLLPLPTSTKIRIISNSFNPEAVGEIVQAFYDGRSQPIRRI